MSLTRRNVLTGAAVAALVANLPLRVAFAQSEKTVRIALPMDYTKVYTFVTAEYAQGQLDYFTMINGRGGVSGFSIVTDVSDHANDQPRAIEAYERAKSQGAVIVDPLSTPVARALTTRALEDKINLITAFSGRSDAADGSVFPFVLPVSPNYWSQATILIDYFKKTDGSLKDKTICFVHIDTPFGKEPLPILETLAAQEGFKLQTFPYTPPGNDQSAIWPQVRRARPDWTIFWGAGGGQTVSLTEAVRNGLPMDRVASCIWLSETEMKLVGADQTKGFLKFSPCESGTAPKVIAEILEEVIKPGKGAGPAEKVGNSYYNYGVMIAAIMVEGIRKAAEKAPDGPVTGEWVNAGLRSITEFNAEGLMPPLTVTPEDHQGGGMGRVVQWDGTAFAPMTEWTSASQDVVWAEVRKYSAEFAKTGK